MTIPNADTWFNHVIESGKLLNLTALRHMPNSITCFLPANWQCSQWCWPTNLNRPCEGRASGKGNRHRTKEQGAERDSRGLGCTGGAWEYKETLRFKATELEWFARINTGATGDQAPRSLEDSGAEVLTITPDNTSLFERRGLRAGSVRIVTRTRQRRGLGMETGHGDNNKAWRQRQGVGTGTRRGYRN